MFKNVKKKITKAGIIDKIKEAALPKKSKEDKDKIVLIDADALGNEPDMRVVGLFSDVEEE